MNEYITSDFMLSSPAAIDLYHNNAAGMPILDYHCHLSPQEIALDRPFASITQAWLGGDHYKWRAMRGNGIAEEYITGNGSDWEKFEKWAATLQQAMRNPLYHWTHLELKRIFGIDAVLSPKNARAIYEECNAKIVTAEYSPRALMRRFGVRAVCTTDDPADSLEHHIKIASDGFEIRVLPTWRPDRALGVNDSALYNAYLEKLGDAAGMVISTYEDLLEALHKRQEHFASCGCRLADHGLDTFIAEYYTEKDLMRIFAKVRSGHALTGDEIAVFRSGLIFDLAIMNHDKGWAQQFHIGAIRNNNSRMLRRLGPDAGYDAINDLGCAAAGHRFLDRLDREQKLAKTILYNLNPKDNEVLAAMAYTFNEAPVPGKIQFGAAWWFLDNEEGIRCQIDALSAMGLLSRFVGMLTDSRSFLSYPRHEYFRRILCEVIGGDIEKGKLPRSEMEFIGSMVEDICYNNAEKYFLLMK